MSRAKDFFKNVIIISFGTILPKVAAFIALPLITGALSKRDYGLYDLIITLVSLLLPIITVQIHMAAFRFLIDERDDEEKTNQIVSNIILFISITTLVSIVILYFALFKFDIPIRLLTCTYYALDVYFNAFQKILRGLSKNKLFSECTVVNSVVNLVLVYLLLCFTPARLGAVLSALCISDLAALIYIFVRDKTYKRINLGQWSRPLIKQMLQFSWPMIPDSLSAWVLKFSDRIVLTIFMGVAGNAVYSVATKLPNTLLVFHSSISYAWQENASVVSKDENVSEYYSQMFDAIFSLVAAVFAVLIAATPVLFKVFIRGDYGEAYPHIPILLMANFFMCMSSHLAGIYIANKKTKSIAVTTLAAAIINLIVDLLLVNRVGIYAASVSTLVSYAFIFLYRLFNVQTFQRVSYPYLKIVVCTVLLIGMSLLCCRNELSVRLINVVIALVFSWVINIKQIHTIVGVIKRKLNYGSKK